VSAPIARKPLQGHWQFICDVADLKIHFAGAAGLDIKGNGSARMVKTEDEAFGTCCGFGADVSRAGALILNAFNNGTNALGLTRPVAQIMDDAGKRKAYILSEFVFQPAICPDFGNPWSERVSGKDKQTSSIQRRPLQLEAAE